MDHFFWKMGDLILGFRQWLATSNDWLTNLASLTAIVAIVFGAVYWFELRRRELKQRRWADYQELIHLAWNRHASGQPVPSALQIAAVYRLLAFREFAYMTVLTLDEAVQSNPGPWIQSVGPHATKVADNLRGTWRYVYQAWKVG
ncbi:MAG TPA: hypothetical protein VJ798_13690 [Rhizomicrobium sp.]|nr:hypothetical protein [Rhizomicrobium sp.]